ncbi:MAG: hypothetical protein M1814_003733 [Vezdaea aestivalis]|nr:MAG: hypothetical protein M1814_003733 [Vezdaea aestivalis]
MASSILLPVLALLVAYYIFNWSRLLKKNIAIAKATGLPYKVLPIHIFSRWWLSLGAALALPLYKKFAPESWLDPLTIKFLGLDWAWQHGYSVFEEVGGEVILVVSAGGIICFVASAEAAHQIVYDREGFPKALALYGVLDVFGKNVVTTEGMAWKDHRKITSTPFTPKSNAMVWTESLNMANAMMKSHVPPGQTTSQTIASPGKDTMTIALSVISRAGFGVDFPWPGQEALPPVKQRTSPDPIPFEPAGHDMSYRESLGLLLDNIFIVLLVPGWILRWLPFEKTKTTYKAFNEWTQYQLDLFERKKDQIRSGQVDEATDLMGALVVGSGLTQEVLAEAATSPKASQPGFSKQLLSDSEIIGNVFIYLLAGHETSAHTLQFAFINLALHPASQLALQESLDQILGGRPVNEWTLETDASRLFDSFTGAVINETLRLFPPAVVIPKLTNPLEPKVLRVGGKSHTLPPNIDISLVTISMHVNPNSWPTYETTDPDGLRAWEPQRWIVKGKATEGLKKSGDDEAITEGVSEGPGGRVTSPSLYKPMKGAYMPFSDGYRSCLGRKFAQVELVAILAIVFSEYSVELAVDEWASDEMVKAMTLTEKQQLWGKAAKKAKWKVREGCGSKMTLQIFGEDVPLKFVKRGYEQFKSK